MEHQKATTAEIAPADMGRMLVLPALSVSFAPCSDVEEDHAPRQREKMRHPIVPKVITPPSRPKLVPIRMAFLRSCFFVSFRIVSLASFRAASCLLVSSRAFLSASCFFSRSSLAFLASVSLILTFSESLLCLSTRSCHGDSSA